MAGIPAGKFIRRFLLITYRTLCIYREPRKPRAVIVQSPPTSQRSVGPAAEANPGEAAPKHPSSRAGELTNRNEAQRSDGLAAVANHGEAAPHPPSRDGELTNRKEAQERACTRCERCKQTSSSSPSAVPVLMLEQLMSEKLSRQGQEIATRLGALGQYGTVRKT
jgi:hypothetical protein